MSEETKSPESNPVESMGLLECPFCGSPPRMHSEDKDSLGHPQKKTWMIECAYKCGAKMRGEYTKDDSIRKWNKRAD